MAFYFSGDIPASKSILNRALVVQSYFPELKIEGGSQAEDVVYMHKALQDLKSRDAVHAGEGGTTFRFLVMRASRLKKTINITAAQSLLARPQKELLSILRQLGVQVISGTHGWEVDSQGWKEPAGPLVVDVSQSSQFLSALLLNAWGLPFDLEIEMKGSLVSEPYLAMTLKMLRELGMQVIQERLHLTVPRGQALQRFDWSSEADVSSAFVVTALAALDGECLIKNFPTKSDQADFVFVDLLQQMNVPLKLSGEGLRVFKSSHLKSIKVSLEKCPDLFPVLSALCAFAEGESHLYGAPHLAHKESNRIQATAELLKLMAVDFEALPDGMKIHGSKKPKGGGVYDPHGDHRMVMAASVFKQMGASLEILHPECVKKSYPEFLEILEKMP